MFVSSYTTHITNSNPDRVSKVNQDRVQNKKSSFSSIISDEKSVYIPKFSSNLPINYISANKSFVNRQELEYQSQDKKDTVVQQTKELTNTLTKYSSIINSKSAYQENSVIFTFMQKPKKALNLTPKYNFNTDSTVEAIQENNLRHVMVNTYLQNDKYYQITA